MSATRRAWLRAGLGLGLGAVSGCILPDRPCPQVRHGSYPLGPMPRPRGSQAYLRVGAAAVDITPPEGAPVWLAGYGFERPMRRIHDPISARALYLDDGARRVALVVADVVGLSLAAATRIRRLVGPGIEVVVASTHNHQGPDTLGYWGPAILHAVPAETGIRPGYQRGLERRMAQAVARAAWSARPARLAAAEAELPPGLVRNLRDPADVPDRMLVLQARSLAGAPLATLVNLACHPETLGDRAQLLSADFPGPLRAGLEAGGGGVGLFVNGALGGMLTADVPDAAELQERLTFVGSMGGALAQAALAAVGRVAPLSGPTPVAYARAEVELAGDNDLYRFLERTGLVEARARGPGGGLMSEVGRLSVGPVALGVMPGEPTPRVGRQVQEILRRAGYDFTGVVGLGNDELGYLLDPAQFDDPEFAYEVSVSPGRGAAPALTAALSRIQSKR